MPTVVGVKLKYSQKPLWFDPADADLEPGDAVVVETERGHEFGHVVAGPQEVPEAELTVPLKRVDRKATHEDLETAEGMARREDEAMPVYRELVAKHKLDMKPIGVEYLFDGSKVVFYFVAEERVDFRELVRELASRFHARIDMRQVGVRDEARMIGGLGHCGEHLCCSRFAGEFQPVSIRMAKEQDLPLNPTKISGLCGRLMCCLRYEYEAYKDFKQRAPKCGTPISTPVGDGKIVELNCPKERLTVSLAEGGRSSVPLAAVDCPGKGCACSVKADELAELEPDSRLLVPAAVLPEPVEDKPRQQQPRQQQPRKRRGSRGSGGEGAKAEPKPPAQPQREAASGQQEESQGQAAGTSGRRRRRRRRPAGGGSGGESGGQE